MTRAINILIIVSHTTLTRIARACLVLVACSGVTLAIGLETIQQTIAAGRVVYLSNLNIAIALGSQN